MKRIIAAAAALAMFALASPAQADPTFMSHDEWLQISEGMTKSKVETICACFGTKTAYTDTQNGNLYTAWEYLTRVGTAYVFYRNASDGTKRVGDEKDWCVLPYGDLGQPEGGCDKVRFY